MELRSFCSNLVTSGIFTLHANTGDLWWSLTMISGPLELRCVPFKISPYGGENLTSIFQYQRFDMEYSTFFYIRFQPLFNLYRLIIALSLVCSSSLHLFPHQYQDNPSDKDINQGTLVVFNLDPSVSNDDLRQIFGAYGEVKEVRKWRYFF